MPTMAQDQALTTLPAGRWEVDPVHSSAGFAVRHMLVATFRGRFEQIAGALVVDGDELSLTGEVDAGSIEVRDESLAAHLASPEFFDSERYPVLRFRSTSLRRSGDELELEGELTIKGQTHPIKARGELSGPAVAFGEQEKLGLRFETSIDRRDYGLEWNAPLPSGGLALANEVTLSIERELARAEEAR